MTWSILLTLLRIGSHRKRSINWIGHPAVQIWTLLRIYGIIWSRGYAHRAFSQGIRGTCGLLCRRNGGDQGWLYWEALSEYAQPGGHVDWGKRLPHKVLKQFFWLLSRWARSDSGILEACKPKKYCTACLRFFILLHLYISRYHTLCFIDLKYILLLTLNNCCWGAFWVEEWGVATVYLHRGKYLVWSGICLRAVSPMCKHTCQELLQGSNHWRCK